jgi:tetratricopeptide (TPR) repeat protein
MRRWIHLLVILTAPVVLGTSAGADNLQTCSKSSGELAIDACSRVISSGAYKGSRLATVYGLRASKFIAAGDHDRAIADLTEAIKLDPRSALAFHTRGIVWQAKGDPERALADFQMSLQLDPQRIAVYLSKGLAWHAKGNDDRAIAELTEAIKIDPYFTAAYSTRGAIYAGQSDYTRAREDLKTAIALPPKYEDGKSSQASARTLLPLVELGLMAGKLAQPEVGPDAVSAAPAQKAALPPIQGTFQATHGRRTALVIGNSAYSSFPKIPNPRNDAEDLAKALTALGFEVLLGTDLSRADMEERLIRFSRQARAADTALVYYAGHGIQHQGINYLAPIDARLEDESDLRRLISLQDVISDLQGASQVRILMVDACRDNEAVQQLASSLPKTRAAAFSRGLAKVDVDGTLVAFATQANRVAADGDGRNSPFAAALLKHLPTPGIELRTLMTRVRADVVQSTEGKQRPEVWDSMVGEFAFKSEP